MTHLDDRQITFEMVSLGFMHQESLKPIRSSVATWPETAKVPRPPFKAADAQLAQQLNPMFSDPSVGFLLFQLLHKNGKTLASNQPG